VNRLPPRLAHFYGEGSRSGARSAACGEKNPVTSRRVVLTYFLAPARLLSLKPRGQSNAVSEDEGAHVPRTARVGEDAATY
jgi:hypothetical protein